MDTITWIVALSLTGVAPLLVNYRPTFPENAADHPTRQLIMEFLDQRPMSTRRALRGSIGGSWSTVQHHLGVLERGGLVKSIQVGRSMRYFLPNVESRNAEAIGVLRGARTRDVVERILERPGIIQQDLTDGLQMSRKMLRTYVDRLVRLGLIREEQVGRHREYHPTGNIHEVMECLVKKREEVPSDLMECTSFPRNR